MHVFHISSPLPLYNFLCFATVIVEVGITQDKIVDMRAWVIMKANLLLVLNVI